MSLRPNKLGNEPNERKKTINWLNMRIDKDFQFWFQDRTSVKCRKKLKKSKRKREQTRFLLSKFSAKCLPQGRVYLLCRNKLRKQYEGGKNIRQLAIESGIEIKSFSLVNTNLYVTKRNKDTMTISLWSIMFYQWPSCLHQSSTFSTQRKEKIVRFFCIIYDTSCFYCMSKKCTFL